MMDSMLKHGSAVRWSNENRSPKRLMTTRLAPRLAVVPWLVALALLQSGCGAGRKLRKLRPRPLTRRPSSRLHVTSWESAIIRGEVYPRMALTVPGIPNGYSGNTV